MISCFSLENVPYLYLNSWDLPTVCHIVGVQYILIKQMHESIIPKEVTGVDRLQNVPDSSLLPISLLGNIS